MTIMIRIFYHTHSKPFATNNMHSLSKLKLGKGPSITGSEIDMKLWQNEAKKRTFVHFSFSYCGQMYLRQNRYCAKVIACNPQLTPLLPFSNLNEIETQLQKSHHFCFYCEETIFLTFTKISWCHRKFR